MCIYMCIYLCIYVYTVAGAAALDHQRRQAQALDQDRRGSVLHPAQWTSLSENAAS